MLTAAPSVFLTSVGLITESDLSFPLCAAQIELAILRFPYDSWGTPFQQLKQVVEEPSPQLPADQFSPEFVDFTSQWYVYSLAENNQFHIFFIVFTQQSPTRG